MKIVNKTKKIILAEDIIIPKTLLDQSLGLLKYKIPHAMLLKTHFGIHTFGMKYTIDVLILDKRNRVFGMKENLKPNNIFLWNPQYETILELPEGIIKKTKTEIGDILELH
jgi:hypothetical protein